MAKPYDYDSYVEMFLDERRQENPTADTYKTYKTALDELGNWLENLPAEALVRPAKAGQKPKVIVPGAIAELADLTHHHLNAHVRYLQTRDQLPGGRKRSTVRQGKLAPATVNNRYRAISSFINWLWTQPDFDDVGPSPMGLVPSPKLVETSVEVFDLDQLRALIDTCGKGRRRPFIDVRDEAIIRVFCEAGPRRSETATIALADVDTAHKRLQFKGATTKGMADRHLFYGNRTRLALDRYLAIRTQHRNVHLPALWLAPKGALTSAGMYQMIRRRGDAAGLKIKPHQLRHSFANRYLAEGGTTENLKAIGGWHSDRAMQIYTRARQADRARAEHAALALGDQL